MPPLIDGIRLEQRHERDVPRNSSRGWNAGLDRTVDQALAAPHTLQVGLIWRSISICLAVKYFCIVYWLFRGKIPIDDESYEL
jgi:hypothetical protein